VKRICVYCGSSAGNKPEYTQVAQELGRLLATKGIGLVYGGGDVGLMGAVATSTLQAGGEVVGVIPEFMAIAELAHPEVTKLHVVESMHERKSLMAELADGFIAMPGGFGTFEEIFEVLTWAQLGLHHKPCGFLNADGFYDRLIDFIDHTVATGFVNKAYRQMIIVEDDLTAILQKFIDYKPPTIDKIKMAVARSNGTPQS
jgi:uncharacterized protein (TIGR00730 family)